MPHAAYMLPHTTLLAAAALWPNGMLQVVFLVSLISRPRPYDRHACGVRHAALWMQECADDEAVRRLMSSVHRAAGRHAVLHAHPSGPTTLPAAGTSADGGNGGSGGGSVRDKLRRSGA
jgi:hypothetical protein